MTKFRRDEEVSMDIIERICECLECNIGDVRDFIPLTQAESKAEGI